MITTLYTPDSQDPEDNIVPRLPYYKNYIIDELLVNLDTDKVSGMVLVNYRKAFDMVVHELLFKKIGDLWYSPSRTQIVSFVLVH